MNLLDHSNTEGCPNSDRLFESDRLLNPKRLTDSNSLTVSSRQTDYCSLSDSSNHTGSASFTDSSRKSLCRNHSFRWILILVGGELYNTKPVFPKPWLFSEDIKGEGHGSCLDNGKKQKRTLRTKHS